MDTLQNRLLFLSLLLWPAVFFSQSSPPLAPYRVGKLWGYANPETGRIVVQPTLDSAGLFRQGDFYNNPVAWVKKNGRYGLINTLGEIALPFQEPEPYGIGKSHHGFSVVVRPKPPKNNEELGRIICESGRRPDTLSVAFFDSLGRAVGPPFMYEILTGGGEWYLEDGDPNDFQLTQKPKPGKIYQVIWKAGKAGVLELKKGKVVVQPAWTHISVHGNIAIAKLRKNGDSSNTTHELQTTLIDLRNGKSTMLPDSILVDERYGNSRLIPAQSKKTRLYGFINVHGRIVIPFQFLSVNSFSANNLTKVQWRYDRWSLIDIKGKEITPLGGDGDIYWLKDDYVWVRSESDGLLRRLHAPPSDVLGRMGFDYPPVPGTLNGKRYWSVRRNAVSGLLDDRGNIILPFEFDHVGILSPQEDSISYRPYISVRKNGRYWLLDGKTLQPRQVNVSPESGLVLGETFDQGNFGLIMPLWGDSLFVIDYPERNHDILNIKTGKRWGIKNHAQYYFKFRDDNSEPIVHYRLRENTWKSAAFRLTGEPVSPIDHPDRPAEEKKKDEINEVPYFEKPPHLMELEIQWNSKTGLFTVYDKWWDLIGYISKNGHVLFEN